ncbi:hypothetical protein NX059_011416 [Plenodomus lindquistii]|nr:hypothetical protein NX059_011416 [Plenodomus lindquistii]
MNGINSANALYRGWDGVELMTGNEDDATSSTAPPSSSFTAINHSPSRSLTSQSSVVAPVQQNQARRRATSRRRHNPAVAEYLGLGSLDEPAHLEKYAPLSAGSELLAAPRKRRKQAAGDIAPVPSRRDMHGETTSGQQLVSQSFHVRKPVRKSSVNKSLSHSFEPPPSAFTQGSSSRNVPLQETPSPSTVPLYDNEVVHPDPTLYNQTTTTQDLSEDTIAASKSQDPTSLSPLAHQDPSVEPDVDSWQSFNADESIDEDDFDCGIVDDDLLSLMLDTSFNCNDDIADTPKRAEKSGRNFEVHAQRPLSDCTSVTTEGFVSPNRPKRSQHSTRTFKSPLTQTSRLLATTGDAQNPDARKPIARPPFPAAVRDRSPIIGLSSNTLLRTCFRIGEVINQSSQASKTGQAVIFELYARVLDSERTDMQQCFTFCDLFHAKPPYIKGTYHATIWKSVQLFEYDSRRLLEKGRMCRCIGTTKRVDRGWVMTVLNIWEATWEDIKWVEGIVAF